MGLTITAGGLPNTRFYLDDGTGTFPDDITGYVLLVEGGGMSLTRGRGDTDSGPTAGTLTITLNNRTGAFTPGSTILGSPTQIKLDQQIRVKETVNGVTYTRGTYYVKSWALSWLAVAEGTAVVRVVATDAQARAERRVLRSVVEEEILADSPSAYYTLGEPAGAASAADSSGNQAVSPIVGSGTAIIFGTDAGPSGAAAGSTVATLAVGQYLSVTVVPAAPVEVWFKTTNTGTSRTLMSNPGAEIGIIIDGATGQLTAGDSIGNTLLGTPVVTDGLWHCLAWQGSTVTLDGVGYAAVFGNRSGNTVLIGKRCPTPATGWPGTTPAVDFIGSMAHLATFAGALLGARLTAHYQAGATGFANESGTARLTRLAGYAGIAVGSADTSLTNIPFVDFTDQSAWQAIQDVADAEMGAAYIAGDGTLTFHNRQRVTIKTAPDLTLNGFIRPDAEAVTDDQDLLNYLTVTSVTTGIDQLVRDTASETAHGRYSDAKSFLVATDGEALDRGNWLVYTRKEPASSGRYGTLTINLYGMTPVQQSAAIAALEHGCWLRAIAMPSQTTGGTTVDVVVEGIAENQSGDDWSVTCNVVSKAGLYPKVFILDSSVLDGPDLLAV